MIEEHLIVKLFLLSEEQDTKFEIKLKLKDEELIISDENIVKFQKQEFKILDTMIQSFEPQYYNFTLYYKFEDSCESCKQFYCAAGRLVEPFTKTVQIKELSFFSKAKFFETKKITAIISINFQDYQESRLDSYFCHQFYQ